jgi:DNA-directed RNA polymerase specialized sigma24 family protein
MNASLGADPDSAFLGARDLDRCAEIHPVSSRADAVEFEPWYRGFHPSLVTVLAATIGDADLAKDSADEALARAWRHWNRVSIMSSPDGWTYRVALNVARRRRRRRSLEHSILRRQMPQAVVPGPTGELWLLVGTLPARQREAVLLRHVGQLTEPEIAEAMRVTRATVSTTLRAAYSRLAIELGTDHAENGARP